jgi:thioredoxin reductase
MSAIGARGQPGKSKSFAVIGAGAAGLCYAKYLLQEGYADITVFEIGTQIGGLWCYKNDSGRSAAYRSLHINTARNLTAFSDLPFDDDVQMFPSCKDMHDYLIKYADKFGVTPLIRFNSRVTSVEPAPDYNAEAPRWSLTTEDGFSRDYDRVIVATGHLSEPLHIDNLRNNFKGEYLHSFDFREPEPFAGKKVCIVGVGNSAVDIASDVCVTTEQTVMVARSGVMIGPKLIFGVPFTDLTMKLYRNWIPDRLRRWVISALVYAVHGPMEKLGFKPLTKRAHPTTSAVVVQHIAYNRVQIKNGIEKIQGKRIFFSDGSSEEFDTMIAATGYQVDLPFIPERVVPIVNNSVSLYKRVVPPQWRGLYFGGFFNTTTALNLVFEHQAKWIASIEAGRMKLPSAAEMERRIVEKQNWIAKYYKASPRHTIEEEHLFYLKELRVGRSSTA